MYPVGTVIMSDDMEGVIVGAKNDQRIIQWSNGVKSYSTTYIISEKLIDGVYAI
jgi:ATP-dependent RNA circularization protein (DNA/RNA ligase family)